MDIRRIIFEIIALVSFLSLCYVYFHIEEVTKVSVNAYIDSQWGITNLTLKQYFKSHNLEPDEDENNN